MSDLLAAVINILLYLFEGYCIQYLFCAFAEPRLLNIKYSKHTVGIVWTIIRLITFLLPSGEIFITLKLLLSAVVLFLFCLLWYKGNLLLKVFLVIQFAALHELALFTAYSFMFICNFGTDIMGSLLYNEIISGKLYLTMINMIMFFSLIIVYLVQGGILLFALKK